jgi:hypothetical protein
MSGEQTAGIVFLRQFLGTVQAFMRASAVPCFIEDLNAQWGALFLPDDYLNLAPTQTLVSELSALLPLLHVNYSEDFRWGYRLFEQGTQRAAVEEDFELYYQFADEEARSSQEQWAAFLAEHEDEILQSPQYLAAYQAQFAQRHVAAFATFRLDQERLNHLETLLGEADPEQEFDHIDRFRAILGVTELRHKSYTRYLREEQRPDWAGTVSDGLQAALAAGRIVRLP